MSQTNLALKNLEPSSVIEMPLHEFAGAVWRGL
jgi:hypothetical protein